MCSRFLITDVGVLMSCLERRGIEWREAADGHFFRASIGHADNMDTWREGSVLVAILTAQIYLWSEETA